MQVSCKKQEHVGCCVQRRQRQQLLLKPKSLPGLSSGTWSTISQGRQHEHPAEVHPPTKASASMGCLANAE